MSDPRPPGRRAASSGMAFGGWLLVATAGLALAGGATHAPAGTTCTAGSGLVLAVEQPNTTAPSVVTFRLTDPSGPPSWVNWSFGDGATFNNTSSGLLLITHQYYDAGNFSVVVALLQGDALARCTATVAVTPAPFSVSIHADPSGGPAPLTVRFVADLSGGSGTYDSALWSFGDGQTATGFNVSYTYEAAGTYTAVLIVEDSASQRAVANLTLHVTPSGANRGRSDGGTGWLLPGVVGAAAAVALLVAFLGWRGRRREPELLPPGAPGPDGGAEEAAAVEVELSGPARGPEPPVAGAPGSLVVLPPSPLPTPAPSPIPPEEVAPAPGAAAVPATPGVEAIVPGGGRAGGTGGLRLSQRVMLHLYRQGHLADGEVAPVGFTQGGMSEQLDVAQSPLSSVLRRLVVAGLVVQDTRHVRGQPRRLRVYRLTPVGESVARELYLHPPEGGAPDPSPAEEP